MDKEQEIGEYGDEDEGYDGGNTRLAAPPMRQIEASKGFRARFRVAPRSANKTFLYAKELSTSYGLSIPLLCGIIKRIGEQSVREIESEIKHNPKVVNITSLFMWKYGERYKKLHGMDGSKR